MSHSQGFSSQRQTPPFVICFINLHVFQLPQQRPISYSSHSIFAFTIPVLLSFLQIQCSGTNPTPFQLHPFVAKASLGCLVAYYLALGAKFMFPTYASHFDLAILLSGSFCVAALVSLILQIPWWSIPFVALLAGGLLLLVLKVYAKHGNGILPRPPCTQQPPLPLYIVINQGYRM